MAFALRSRIPSTLNEEDNLLRSSEREDDERRWVID